MKKHKPNNRAYFHVKNAETGEFMKRRRYKKIKGIFTAEEVVKILVDKNNLDIPLQVILANKAGGFP